MIGIETLFLFLLLVEFTQACSNTQSSGAFCIDSDNLVFCDKSHNIIQQRKCNKVGYLFVIVCFFFTVFKTKNI